MAKNVMDKNFENLKAQMMRKKDMAKKHEDVREENEVEELETIEELVELATDVEVEETTQVASAPRIVIKKQEKQDIPKRITYYLNNSTIKKIDKYSKAAGMGKSAFVQTLLDIALENLEIE